MFFFYKLLFLILHPFLIIFLKIRVFKKKEDAIRYKEKLGYPSLNTKSNLIWFHVASLGEIKSIHSIIKHYQKIKGLNFLITSVTTSSFNYFNEHLKSENTFHQYAPIDSPIIIKRFLNFWQPKLSIFVESEIWPNMIFQTSEKCKLILFNARISKNSFKKWKSIKNFFKHIMNKFDYILPQSREVLEILESFNLKKIISIGNIKYTNLNKNLPNVVKINNTQKKWAAMSIHNDEVDYIIQTHKHLSLKQKDLLTFLIPRHLNKIDNQVEKIKKENLPYLKISNQDKINDFHGIVIIDRFGLADDIFNKVKIVFMGGSFIDHGGQNPIEPLKYGCQILTGKNIHNFNEIYNELIHKKIATIVDDQSDLEKKLMLYFNDYKNISYQSSSDYKEFSDKILKKTIEFLDNYIH